MTISAKTISIVVLLFLPCAIDAGVTVNKLFTSDMVLQHGKTVPVWGTAAAGKQVTVTINGQSKTATPAS